MTDSGTREAATSGQAAQEGSLYGRVRVSLRSAAGIAAYPPRRGVAADPVTGTCRSGQLPRQLPRRLRWEFTEQVAYAQDDTYLADAAADFTAQRRHELGVILERGRQRGELAAEADLDTLVDLAYGFLWYRLLVGHAPLDRQAAQALADCVLAAGGG